MVIPWRNIVYTIIQLNDCINININYSYMKKSHQLEYIIKGFDNKRRIDILFLLDQTSELSVSEIARNFRISYVAVSNHLLKMMSRGVVMKQNQGKEVRHALTEKGKKITEFLRLI